MTLTTLQFAAFFAIVWLGYYLVPRKWQWLLLLVASYAFYSAASPICLVYLLGTTVATYIGACLMDSDIRRQKDYLKGDGRGLSREEKKAYKARREAIRKRIVAAVAIVVLGLLGVFKYSDFILKNASWLMGILGRTDLSFSVKLALPIGLSFYVFQSLGYCIDVYREEVPAERNFFRHALFVSYFPQILQGPIGVYGRLAPQLVKGHAFDYRQAVCGMQRIAWGLFKKFMIANTLADRINPAWGDVASYPGFFCWAVILTCYSIQLYADFSGYMDIACGCSQMLGIELDENFNTPYFARNIGEFWRKWHITLGRWFKDYLFYPLLRSEGLSSLRKKFKSKYIASMLPTVLALVIVWFLIGLWHGADWSYVVYGLYHGMFIVMAVMLEPVYDRLHNAFPKFFASRICSLLQIARTFAIVTLGYAIFKPGNLKTTCEIVSQMTQWRLKESIYQAQYLLHHSFVWVALWIMVFLFVDIYHFTAKGRSLRGDIQKLPTLVRWPMYVAFVLCVVFYGLYGSGFDNFEYFKF